MKAGKLGASLVAAVFAVSVAVGGVAWANGEGDGECCSDATARCCSANEQCCGGVRNADVLEPVELEGCCAGAEEAQAEFGGAS